MIDDKYVVGKRGKDVRTAQHIRVDLMNDIIRRVKVELSIVSYAEVNTLPMDKNILEYTANSCNR